MQQPYNNAVITDGGISLLDKVQAGRCAIQFTRMATGDGTYSAGDGLASALQKRTGLKSERNSYPLSSADIMPGGGVKLVALITNQDPVTGEVLVNEGYHINEIGLFAKEKEGDGSTEVLYSTAIAAGGTGDYMPPYTGGTPDQILQEYHAKVGGVTQVAINSTGAAIPVDEKGTAGGVATLDADGRVPASQLPAASSLGISSTRLDTVLPAAWEGADPPFTQTIALEGVAADSIVDLDVSGSVTAEELDAYIAARIVDGGQDAGSITLKAFGEKPGVAIPVKIVVRGV